MSLSDRINDKFEAWRQDVTKGLAGFMVNILGKGIEFLMDRMEEALRPQVKPLVDKILANPETPPELKSMLTSAMEGKSFAWMPLLAGLAGGIASSGAGAVLLPGLERIKQSMSDLDRFQIHDFPIVLAAWLRDLPFPEDIFDDLRKRGWHEARIELFKQLVWLRLDPDIVQRIWLRDKDKYEKLWTDLHDVGWDDERIDVYKTLAWIIPGAADIIRMAVREVFTPEIVEKYGQMEDFPPDFAKWGEKIGLTEEWAKNYWAAHWDLPSPTQGFEMLHRGVITYDDLKVLLRALDVMPYWRDKLIKIAYTPYTRVDVRRMYRLGILDLEGVKRAYLDLGYDEEHAQGMTDFTEKYYAAATEEEIDKERDLTRSDITTGYKRGMLTLDEATELLDQLGYTPDQITYYLSREDQAAVQDRKDAYASNYRQLYVTGLIDDEVVKSDLVEIGFEKAEVTELLQLWYIERVRRVERPSRSDLGRFYKKGIITLERYQAEMAMLGWSDEYISWYFKDLED